MYENMCKIWTNEHETGKAGTEFFCHNLTKKIVFITFLCMALCKEIYSDYYDCAKNWLLVLESLTGYCTHLSGHWTPNCEQLTMDTR